MFSDAENAIIISNNDFHFPPCILFELFPAVLIFSMYFYFPFYCILSLSAKLCNIALREPIPFFFEIFLLTLFSCSLADFCGYCRLFFFIYSPYLFWFMADHLTTLLATNYVYFCNCTLGEIVWASRLAGAHAKWVSLFLFTHFIHHEMEMKFIKFVITFVRDRSFTSIRKIYLLGMLNFCQITMQRIVLPPIKICR